jgi:hypothetical protein
MLERSPPRRLKFYRRLSAEQRKEYDRSDARRGLPLAPNAALSTATNAVVASLETGSPVRVTRAAQQLVDEICAALAARSRLRRSPPAPRVKVLRTRPRTAGSEFHGLYTRYESGQSEIRVWMFTAAQKQIVKPRTFLRTLLHEVCHHVDMTWLDLPSSLHTLGFHARESSLVRALERSGARIPGGKRSRDEHEPVDNDEPSMREAPKPTTKEPAPAATQLELFGRLVGQPSARSERQRPS